MVSFLILLSINGKKQQEYGIQKIFACFDQGKVAKSTNLASN